MIPEEVEKEFEEWWKNDAQGAAWYWSKKACSREAYLEAHAQQEKRIERLREGIKCFLSRLKGEDHGIPGFVLDELQKLLEES